MSAEDTSDHQGTDRFCIILQILILNQGWSQDELTRIFGSFGLGRFVKPILLISSLYSSLLTVSTPLLSSHCFGCVCQCLEPSVKRIGESQEIVVMHGLPWNTLKHLIFCTSLHFAEMTSPWLGHHMTSHHSHCLIWWPWCHLVLVLLHRQERMEAVSPVALELGLSNRVLC